MRRTLSMLVLLAATLAAVAVPISSAETVIVRNDWSYVGQTVGLGCGETSYELTVFSGWEHQMVRSHFDRDGNLVWYAEQQTHSTMKAVSSEGETFILQEVDTIFVRDDAQMWIGQQFFNSVGRDHGTLSLRAKVVYRSVFVEGEGWVDQISLDSFSCTP